MLRRRPLSANGESCGCLAVQCRFTEYLRRKRPLADSAIIQMRPTNTLTPDCPSATKIFINMPTSDDEDALIASLEAESENDPTFSALRETRIQALSTTLAAAKSARNEGFGTYARIRSEQELLSVTTSHTYKRCVVHFFKEDFNRCRIMDGHLGALAERHLEARFLRISVEDAPFLVSRLRVRVLPCVIGFVGGVEGIRIVGFEGLGVGDVFETGDLERVLVGKGVLEEEKEEGGLGVRRRGGQDIGWSKSQSSKRVGNEDEDDDWD